MNKVCLTAVASLLALFAARCGAVTLTEYFTNNPAQDGWQTFGDASLFQWDSTNDAMDVTWDSSQSNSYFYHPLGTTLTKADDFTVSFDIQLNDIAWTGYPVLAVGLFNYNDATNAGYSRPGVTTPNIFEYDYYPDDGLGAPNVAASLADMTVSATNFNDFYFIFDYLPMDAGTTYQVRLMHAAGEASLTGTMSTGDAVYTMMPNAFPGPITDFQLDTIAINNYEDDSDPLLAHGTVGNFTVTMPPVVRNLAGAFSNGVWQALFGTYTGWTYTLERSTNLVSWSDVSAGAAGTGDVMTLFDTNSPPTQAYYTVRANQR